MICLEAVVNCPKSSGDGILLFQVSLFTRTYIRLQALEDMLHSFGKTVRSYDGVFPYLSNCIEMENICNYV